MKSRSFGFFALSATFLPWSPLVNCFTRHSMFDWPEQTHTSPARTFLRVKVFLPAMVTVSLSLAWNVPTRTIHQPSSRAVVPSLIELLASFPETTSIVTVTFSPGSAVPQIGQVVPRWRTMLSEKSGCGLTSARAAGAASAASPASRINRRVSLERLRGGRGRHGRRGQIKRNGRRGQPAAAEISPGAGQLVVLSITTASFTPALISPTRFSASAFSW